MTAFRPARLAVALLLATCCVAGTASAAPTAADRETARTLMEEGRELRDRKDLKGALDRFQRADSIMHVPTTGYELAATQAALGLLVEARDTVARVRSTPPPANEPLPFREARKRATALDNAIAGRVPGVTITVQGAPAGVEPAVTIDDVPVPNAVLGVARRVDPGHHVIVAKIDGAEGRQEVDVKEGETKDVPITLVAVAGTPPVEPPPGEPTPVAPQRESRTLTYVGFGVGALGVAGLGVGAVTGILTLTKKSSLNKECTDHQCPPSADGTLDSAHTLSTVSTIAFIAGGVCVGAGLVAVLVGGKKKTLSDDGTHAAVLPWIGPGGIGVSGRF